jgi:hypothetical protein
MAATIAARTENLFVLGIDVAEGQCLINPLDDIDVDFGVFMVRCCCCTWLERSLVSTTTTTSSG